MRVRVRVRVHGVRGSGPVVAVLVSVPLTLLAGCGPNATGAPVTSSTAAAPSAPSAPSAALQPATAADVRATGMPVTADEWTLWLRADSLEVSGGAGGSQVLTASPMPGSDVAALVAAPEGSRFEVLDDGAVVVLDPLGVPVAGLTTPTESSWDGPVARFELREPDLLVLTSASTGASTAEPGAEPSPRAVRSAFGTATALTAVWGEAEGGRSLAVTPTDWVRLGGGAAEAVGWAAVLRVAPDAGTDGMQDQLGCHVLGAPDKATWNLEPWRPAVGYVATLVARCNP